MSAKLSHELVRLLAIGAHRRASIPIKDHGTSSGETQPLGAAPDCLDIDSKVSNNSGEQTSVYHELSGYNEEDEYESR